MAKPEWGIKRICLNCGARFYDMLRDPIVCPACNTAFDPQAQTKARRPRPPAKVVATAAAEEIEPDLEIGDEPDVELEDAELEDAELEDEEAEEEPLEVAEDESEEEGDSAIEDVSELGDDDMSDVIDTDLEDDDAER